MANTHQAELLREMNERIPRGARGSQQRELRNRFWFWRQQGHSYDDSYAKAVEGVRAADATFEPLVFPPAGA